MSFSGTVKEELAEYISPARHCQLAELAALFHFGGRLTEDGCHIKFDVENEAIARKCFTLLKKTFNINNVMREEDEEKVFQALHLYDEERRIIPPDTPVNALLIKNNCSFFRLYSLPSFLVKIQTYFQLLSFFHDIVHWTLELILRIQCIT